MAAQPKKLYTPAEYLALERQAEYKSEYVDGEIFAMAGGSKAHYRIERNLVGYLFQRLQAGCEVFTSNVRVGIRRRKYYYPDTIVVCGETIFEDEEVDTLLNPTIVFEVLSTSTGNYDKGQKADQYRTLPSLKELVLIEQNKYHVLHYIRLNDNSWQLKEYKSQTDSVDLISIGCQLRMAEIYQLIPIGEETDDLEE